MFCSRIQIHCGSLSDSRSRLQSSVACSPPSGRTSRHFRRRCSSASNSQRSTGSPACLRIRVPLPTHSVSCARCSTSLPSPVPTRARAPTRRRLMLLLLLLLLRWPRVRAARVRSTASATASLHSFLRRSILLLRH